MPIIVLIVSLLTTPTYNSFSNDHTHAAASVLTTPMQQLLTAVAASNTYVAPSVSVFQMTRNIWIYLFLKRIGGVSGDITLVYCWSPSNGCQAISPRSLKGSMSLHETSSHYSLGHHKGLPKNCIICKTVVSTVECPLIFLFLKLIDLY